MPPDKIPLLLDWRYRLEYVGLRLIAALIRSVPLDIAVQSSAAAWMLATTSVDGGLPRSEVGTASWEAFAAHLSGVDHTANGRRAQAISAYSVALDLVRALRPIVEKLKLDSRDLADQIELDRCAFGRHHRHDKTVHDLLELGPDRAPFADRPLATLTADEDAYLLRLEPAAKAAAMKTQGRYTGWRLVIGADGVWHVFRRYD